MPSSHFIVQIIKTTFLHNARFNKINNLYCFIKGFLNELDFLSLSLSFYYESLAMKNMMTSLGS